MTKKHWIYIKRGLSEDPKHRAAMGECVWLFMHIIDRADWETGIAYGWKDEQEAADMSMSLDTLRRQRTKLEKMDYIRCRQNKHSQDITIMEWRNPRDYVSEVKNPRSESLHGSPPLEGEGDNEGLNKGNAQVKTPSLDSKSKSSSLSRARLLQSFDLFVSKFDKFITDEEMNRWLAFLEQNSESKVLEIMDWAVKKEIHMTNRAALMDSLETAAARWSGRKPRGRKINKVAITQKSLMEALDGNP
jgi:hypothetical protein